LGLEELLNSLRENEHKQIDDIWKTANKEADSLRSQVAEALDAVTKKHAEQLAAACHKSTGLIFLEAENKAQSQKLLAYQALERAARRAADRELSSLRTRNYQAVFTRLVRELPGCRWEKILVNPADQELAAKFFAPDIILPDPDISGGLLAFAKGGKIMIDNTFEKRLERIWPEIFPAIIKKIEKKYGGPGNVAGPQ